VTDVPTLIYELALRSLDQQERELAELRTRTNTVIAAAALIASFLSAAAVERGGGLSGLAFAALVVFVLTAGLSLLVLWPRELRFAFDARRTYAELYRLSGKVAEAQLRVAYGARDRYDGNKIVIDRLELAFEGAVLTLGAQTLLWVLALAVA
jgi:ABC-type transport system involved in cytochrome bd biosynthesis fused ATPase/permease subunit